MLAASDEQRLRKQYPVLNGLSDETLQRLREQSVLVSAEDGRVLLEQGDFADKFVFPLEGGTRAIVRSSEDREITLDRVRPGDCCTLSASCLFGACPSPARGVAEGALTAVVLPGELFFHVMDESSAFRRFIFGGISRRFVKLVETIERVTFQTVEKRLANALLERRDPIRVTHQALAMELGSVREIISRHLKTFENRGFVSLARQRIEILNRDGLQELLSGVNGDGASGAAGANA
ncbi:MAG TPA: Crp/Fnr family transcriptional regulator [Phycisphaerae bacterium]|nr:Crp/Fnr family transcriptional regulator [Phycisphaerae bacterium]HRW51376.1 Crp/Fnr family transcriptional regulator [Phycisphaerae bacterium]